MVFEVLDVGFLLGGRVGVDIFEEGGYYWYAIFGPEGDAILFVIAVWDSNLRDAF